MKECGKASSRTILMSNRSFDKWFCCEQKKNVFSKEGRSSATVTFSTESAFVPFVLGFLTLVLRGENRRILNSGLTIITVRNPEVNKSKHII